MSVTDLELRCGFVPHPYWIGHCKELYLPTVEILEHPRKPWHECPLKRLMIREAFVHFGLLEDKEEVLAMVGGLGIDIVPSPSLGSY